MELRLQELRAREVIDISSGERLGYVSDALLDPHDGRILALIVPGTPRFLGLFGRGEDYILPWKAVTRFGSDMILIDGTKDLQRR